MSASREKNQRQNIGADVLSRKQKEAMEEEKKRKRIRLYTILVCACIVLLAAAVIFFSSGVSRRVLTAAVVDGEKVPVDIYTYYYTNYYGQMYSQMSTTYGDYASYFMPSNISYVKSMQYDENRTWHEFLVDSTADAISSLRNYERLAKEEGFTLTEELRAEIEENIAAVTEMAQQNNMSVNAYLSRSLGKGMTLETYRQELERSYLADGYREYKHDSLSYSPEELESYYTEHADELDTFSFRLTYLRASDQENYNAEDTAAAMESLRTIWDEVGEKLQSGSDYYETLVNYLPESSREGFGEGDSALSSVQGASLSADYGDWVRDPARKENDVTFIETEGGAYLLQFVSRDSADYLTRDFSYVLYPITISAADYNTDEEYEAALNQTAQYAESMFGPYLQSWTEGGKTVDSFLAAAASYGEATGVSVEAVEASRKGAYGEVSDWLFDTERKVGDVELIYSDTLGGYVMVCYTGENAAAHLQLAEDAQREADYTAWEEAVEAQRAENASTRFTFWRRLIGA